MKERPILFQGSMVRALLDGMKTQTRRVCKNEVYGNGFHFDGHHILCHNDYLPPSALLMDYRKGGFELTTSNVEGWGESCPHGLVGDRLWVREAWRVTSKLNSLPPRDIPPRKCTVFFDAGGSIANQTNGQWDEDRTYSAEDAGDWVGKYRPPMFMPRWASRLTLEITAVRVERLQEISEADAQAEGAAPHVWDASHGAAELIDWPSKDDRNPYRNGYALLWEGINGPGSWAANPWVWVVEFKVVAP